MTSVPFEFNVTILTDTGRNERYDAVDFRFTTKAARALERAAGSGINWLVVRGQTIEALVLLVCYGLQHAFPKMTEAKAVDLIQAFIDRGGDIADLGKAVNKALSESGVYGRPEADAEVEADRPLTAPREETTAPIVLTN